MTWAVASMDVKEVVLKDHFLKDAFLIGVSLMGHFLKGAFLIDVSLMDHFLMMMMIVDGGPGNLRLGDPSAVKV